MSKRYQILRRLRYLRNHPEILDRYAEECGVELCKFTGECDSCSNPKPDARVWASISRAETTEVNEFVCADCLPDYHRQHLDWVNWYSTRQFKTALRHEDQQWAKTGRHTSWMPA